MCLVRCATFIAENSENSTLYSVFSKKFNSLFRIQFIRASGSELIAMWVAMPGVFGASKVARYGERCVEPRLSASATSATSTASATRLGIQVKTERFSTCNYCMLDCSSCSSCSSCCAQSKHEIRSSGSVCIWSRHPLRSQQISLSFPRDIPNEIALQALQT